MQGESAGYWDPAPTVASADLAFDNPGGTFYHLGPPESYLKGRREQRNPLNVPGPFYCGETDTCWTGRIYAPTLVLYDDDGMEFVFRQPANPVEMHALLSAAAAAPAPLNYQVSNTTGVPGLDDLSGEEHRRPAPSRPSADRRTQETRRGRRRPPRRGHRYGHIPFAGGSH